MSNRDRFLELRQRYDSFVYEDYKYDVEDFKINLEFSYCLHSKMDEDIKFKHKVKYDLPHDFSTSKLELANFENMIFSIGLVETINYYKTACPSVLDIRCGKINDEQKKWWQKLFYLGLGEFIYLNGLEDDFSNGKMFDMLSNEEKDLFERKSVELNGFLLPVGGGKDSVLTLERLKGFKGDSLPFVMSAPKAAYDCIEIAEYEDYLKATRIFDKTLFSLNGEGYLNGHVPFSAILAFISSFGAVLTGKKYIALSNEKSANEPTVHGKTFNHQYSKSYEFEQDFFEYSTKYLIKELYYFSFLRPLYEIDIARKFSVYEQYLDDFRSCNRGKKENVWCSECSKCLFVYIILLPYVKKDKLVKIFGKDMLDEASLEGIFKELIGVTEQKPFECVGTVSEIRYSLKLALAKEDGKRPYLLEKYREYYEEVPEIEDVDEGHNVPINLISLLEG